MHDLAAETFSDIDRETVPFSATETARTIDESKRPGRNADQFHEKQAPSAFDSFMKDKGIYLLPEAISPSRHGDSKQPVAVERNAGESITVGRCMIER
jgi:hypothetical protein